MRGLWLENQRLRLRTDLPDPKPSQSEALVRVHLTGICRTDLELEKGYYPFTGVPGHEFVGTVVQSPSRPSLEGGRVVGEINAVCHECAFCRRGLPNHCLNRTVLGIAGRHGSLAEYLVLPVENLKVVPASVPDQEAVFVEPLAAALQVIEQVHIRPTDRVLLVGAGKLGQLVARVLHRCGCRLLVKARYPLQMKLLDSVGITSTVDTPNKGQFDIVVEATGSPEGLETACHCVRPRGTIVLKSTYEGRAPLDFSHIVVDEITMVGSRCGPFEPTLAMLEKGEIRVGELVERRFPLEEAVAAFRHARHRAALKVLIEVES